MTTDRERMEVNQLFWNEVVPIHAASKFYDVDSFKAGRTSLLPIELREMGGVRGKSLLHLQCHFGMDTLSWSREGAIVTGADFAPVAIAQARSLASELGIPAAFIESNLYDLPDVLRDTFDIVFTSYGAIIWLPDIQEWAGLIANFLRPGGYFYIVEAHPFLWMLESEPPVDQLKLVNSYFGKDSPATWDDDGTYADMSAKLTNRKTYEYQRTLGDIVTALVDAGLRIEFLHEHPECAWPRIPSMVRGDDGLWRLPGNDDRVPFLFSIKASKPV